jgi:predicted methyltransferase
LKGRAVARVIRALCDFRPPYNTSELAERSNASIPTTSRVVNLLYSEKLLTKEGRGLVRDVAWTDLIRHWTRDYAVLTSNETRNFIEPRGLDSLQKKLARLKTEYTVTGSLAARIPHRWHPHAWA